ncbi:MAG: hypothetical protein KIH64_004220 [Mycobacterium sp.]|nr:hypothetical protein [Mycobacterium sp.]
MKAYHVYILSPQFPENAGIGNRKFELLTHIYSCINHKTVNPEIPLVLITDQNTLKYYDDWQLTGLYDEVVTDLHDDYPRDRISQNFWASPKLWAMSKLRAPFLIFDTDLVLNKPLARYATDCDLLYLHRETTATYPNIFDIVGPPGFVWSEDLVGCFQNTLPMNCAVTGIFNEQFKADYVRRYFEFVLDAPGEVQYTNPNSHRMHQCSAAQIVLEQWLLAALAYYLATVAGIPTRTKAVVKALWTPDGLSPLDMDLRPGSEALAAEQGGTFFHLWGAKRFQNDPDHRLYESVRRTLLRGRSIVEESPQYPVVRDVYDDIIAQLTVGC